MEATLLTTDRLLLRRFLSADGEDLFAYLSDAAVVRYEPYSPMTRAQCDDMAASRAQSEDFLAVCLADTGRMIGNVYMARGDHENFEMGYVFSRAHWHMGYAAEAARAAMQDAFERRGAHRIFAQCNPDNTASWKLLERIGFRREGHLLSNVYFSRDANGNPLWQDTYLYGLLRAEWRRMVGEA